MLSVFFFFALTYDSGLIVTRSYALLIHFRITLRFRRNKSKESEFKNLILNFRKERYPIKRTKMIHPQKPKS